MPPGEQWHISGNAAELYEQVVVRYHLRAWAPTLIEPAGLQTGERVLDIASTPPPSRPLNTSELIDEEQASFNNTCKYRWVC